MWAEYNSSFKIVSYVICNYGLFFYFVYFSIPVLSHSHCGWALFCPSPSPTVPQSHCGWTPFCPSPTASHSHCGWSLFCPSPIVEELLFVPVPLFPIPIVDEPFFVLIPLCPSPIDSIVGEPDFVPVPLLSLRSQPHLFFSAFRLRVVGH